MIAGMSYYSICMYFLLYSFLGWVVEVMYHAVTVGKIINRGFLNGPVCPVYGFGMLAVLACGNALSGSVSDATRLNGFTLFLFGMVLATAVELIAGWALDRLFHARWWDYSDKPFNVHGYICLEFSIIWGLAIVLVVKVVHPLLSLHTVNAIPEKYGWWIMLGLYMMYLFDLIVTVLTVSGANRRLKELDEIRKLMRKPSDKLSEAVGTTTMNSARRIEEGQVQASLARSELRESAEQAHENMDLKLAEVKAKRDEMQTRAEELAVQLTSGRFFGNARLLKAFPSLKHELYEETMEEIKKRNREK